MISYFQQVYEADISSGVFPSGNDQIDDLSIPSILSSFLPFVIGDCLSKSSLCDLQVRHAVLKDVFLFWNTFACLVRQLGVHEFREIENASTARESKIKNYQKQKELKINFQKIFSIHSGSLKKFDEEDLREIFLKILEFFAIECENQMKLLKDEIPFLERFLESEKFRSSATKDSSLKASTTPVPPLRVKKIERAEILSQVFRPDIPMPTMTLEQFADEEMKSALKGNANETNGAHSDSDSEENEAKARAWDDWKDDNPRGSGNRGGNIG